MYSQAGESHYTYGRPPIMAGAQPQIVKHVLVVGFGAVGAVCE